MAKYKFDATEKSILRKMFWNSGLVFAGFNQVKMEGNAFTNTMAPVVNEYYKDEEERKQALVRHNGFFNTHAVMFALIAGLTYALEKEKMTKGSVDDDTIESIKISLMGPTAGFGDAFFFNTVRVIAAGICIGFASQGNIIGPLLFVLIYGGGQMIMRYYLLRVGYVSGTSFIDKIFESGLINALTTAASIIGLTMVGAMVATTVNVKLNWIINAGGAEIVVLDVLDKIMPGILSLVLLFALVKLIKKGVKPIYLVCGVMVVSIVLAFFKVF